MKNKILIVGADIEIIELIQTHSTDYEIFGIVDNNIKDTYHKIKVIGQDSHVVNIPNLSGSVEIVITIDDPHTKERLYEYYRNHGFSFAKIVSNKAIVSPYAHLEDGIIIQNGVNVGPNVIIKSCTKLNTNANIMHDVSIGKYCTIAPNVVALGYVEIGNGVFLGANSTVLPRVRLDDYTTIGAGAVVTKNTDKNKVYVGNPARLLDRSSKQR